VKPVVAQIAQNHVVTHFRHETIAEQFDLKNVWIFSFPLVVNLSWERLELAILEASDQMISFALHGMLIS
jgi:hypothetical protein